jgi:membrane-bound lytic murein transglycosylase C
MNYSLFKPARVAAAVAASLLVSSCTTEQVINAALSKDPKAMVRNMAKSKVETYKRDPRLLLSDFERLQTELDRLFGNVRQESEKKWGKEESEVLPGAKVYVKYTEQYKNRIIVDYEKSTIRIEHIQDPQAAKRVRDAVMVALLTPQDPKSADVFSDKEVDLSGTPFLQTLVLDQNGRTMQSREDVERYADYLAGRIQQRRIVVKGRPIEVVYVDIDMIGAAEIRLAAANAAKAKKSFPRPPRATGKPLDLTPDQMAADRGDPNNYKSADKLAPRFLPIVNKYAEKTGVDPSLIFGIIYTESRFNPYAVSTAQAYGMMQLVPKSGGIEAYRRAKGEQVAPTKEYLMDPENNIELGATYIQMLLFDHWMKGVGNLPSREYCAISAYNTGPGNLAKAFTGTSSRLGEAQSKANGMQAHELFDFLRANLPYQETRDYLHRVAAARLHYKEMFYSGKTTPVEVASR